jgi:hypothetical protein
MEGAELIKRAYGILKSNRDIRKNEYMYMLFSSTSDAESPCIEKMGISPNATNIDTTKQRENEKEKEPAAKKPREFSGKRAALETGLQSAVHPDSLDDIENGFLNNPNAPKSNLGVLCSPSKSRKKKCILKSTDQWKQMEMNISYFLGDEIATGPQADMYKKELAEALPNFLAITRKSRGKNVGKISVDGGFFYKDPLQGEYYIKENVVFGNSSPCPAGFVFSDGMLYLFESRIWAKQRFAI